jgi:hypothetical protein
MPAAVAVTVAVPMAVPMTMAVMAVPSVCQTGLGADEQQASHSG